MFKSPLEILLIFGLLMARIWLVNIAGAFLIWPLTIIPILLVILSWRCQGDSWKSLGFLSAGSIDDKVILAFVFLLFWRAIGLVGEFWNPDFLLQKGLWWKFPLSIILYFPWSFFQQLLLNGYFVNRLAALIKIPWLTSLLAGILFAVVHLPNPVLVIAGLFGGILSAYFFQKSRNLYLLAILHAILAVSIKYFLPDAWHHNLKIGPHY